MREKIQKQCRTSRSSWVMVAMILVFLFQFTGRAQANTVAFDYNLVFSGIAPEGDSPWLSAIFDDDAAAAGWDVRLTASALNLATGIEGEFISAMYFNLNPALSPTRLEFNVISASDMTLNAIYKARDDYQTVGDSYYDIKFDFAPPPLDYAARFADDEIFVVDIRHRTSTLTASSFSYLSSGADPSCQLMTAARIENICGDQTGWVGTKTVVPEPISATLYLLGAGVFGGALRRKMTSLKGLKAAA